VATTAEILERLQNKFRNVPTVDETVLSGWLAEAVAQHGYTTVEDVPANQVNALVFLAYAVASEDLWANSSHYFRYQDGDEMVDKSMSAIQYQRQAEYYRNLYSSSDAGESASGTRKSAVAFPKRVDR
jgi:hypothetical protein